MTFLKIVGATQPKAKVAEFIDKCTILQIYHYYGGYFYGYLFVCVCVCACVHALMCTMTHMWNVEDNLGESILSFYHVVSGD